MKAAAAAAQTRTTEAPAQTATEQVLEATYARPFTASERDIILRTCCGGASEREAQQLIAIAEARGLNPIKGECYFVKRWDSESQSQKWAVQASIDSFRIKADETGLYDGQDEPEYEYKAGSEVPSLARVKVYRKGIGRPFVGVARYSEYVQTKKDGTPTKFWKNMPHTMLAKCAEGLGMRKAFPARFAGIYTREEMEQAETPREEPPHDPQTGEVRESQPPPAPTAHSQMAAHLRLERELIGCADLADLATVWARVNAEAKAGGITKAQRAELSAVKDRVKRSLDEMAQAARDAEDDRANDVGDDPAGLGP